MEGLERQKKLNMRQNVCRGGREKPSEENDCREYLEIRERVKFWCLQRGIKGAYGQKGFLRTKCEEKKRQEKAGLG